MEKEKQRKTFEIDSWANVNIDSLYVDQLVFKIQYNDLVWFGLAGLAAKTRTKTKTF